MELADKIRLRKNHAALCDQLRYCHLSVPLIQVGLITYDDHQRITAEVTDTDKITALLAMLPTRGTYSFAKFVTIIERDYEWLAKKLRETEVIPEDLTDHVEVNNNNQAERLKQEISNDMISVLRKNIQIVRRWTALAHALSLSRQAQSIRVRVSIFNEDQDSCVTYLLEEWRSSFPRMASLGGLLKVLRAEDFNDAADRLEKQFL